MFTAILLDKNDDGSTAARLTQLDDAQLPLDADYLKSLGAVEVIDRAELSAASKPLQKERWAGVVDAVGSHTLANAVAQTRYGGTVTACGLAPLPKRLAAWERLANELDAGKLAAITREIGLAEAISLAPELLAGKLHGRLVVNTHV